jgi:hypothetical protein
LLARRIQDVRWTARQMMGQSQGNAESEPCSPSDQLNFLPFLAFRRLPLWGHCQYGIEDGELQRGWASAPQS